MNKRFKSWLYLAAVLLMSVSCNKETPISDVECSKLPTVVNFKDETARTVWQPENAPDAKGVIFEVSIDGWKSYRSCSLPKELQIDNLKIKCSGRTVKTGLECGPNVRCNLNSVIVDSYVILETPPKK